MAIRLFRTQRFLPLFLTQFCGAFNDNLLKNALVILITYRSVTVFGVPSEQMVALAGGIFILPFFLFSATAGQLADKYDKARIIFWVKTSELLIMGIATIGFWTSQVFLLLTSLFLMGIHSTFFGPVKYSILPQHLSTQELVSGNAWVEAGTFLAILLGTLFGGYLVSISVWFITAMLIFVAFVGFVCCRYIPPAPPPAHEIIVQWNLVTPTVSLIRLARADRKAWNRCLAISWFWGFGATVLSLLPTMGKNILAVDESVITLFLAVFSLGVGIGSVSCGWLCKKRVTIGPSKWGAAGISIFCAAVFFLLRGLKTTQLVLVSIGSYLQTLGGWCLVLSFFAIAISSGFYAVPLYTLLQGETAPGVRSRVIAANNIFNALFMVVSAVALALLLGEGLSVAQAFGILAITNGAASWIFLRSG